MIIGTLPNALLVHWDCVLHDVPVGCGPCLLFGAINVIPSPCQGFVYRVKHQASCWLGAVAISISVSAMTWGSGTVTMVSQDPKIWVVDDFLPAEFLQMVNSTFDSAQTKCQVVKKPNGREILARNIDFNAKDELSQEVFQRISKICGIFGSSTCGFTQFMISEVCASGQDSHVDHVNVDDVGSSKLSFLDLTRQSRSEAEPRRVVPTISIIVS